MIFEDFVDNCPICAKEFIRGDGYRNGYNGAVFCGKRCADKGLAELTKLRHAKAATDDPVENPSHYKSHPSGVECIAITEHMNFTLGNAIKYIWRADLKNGIEDLEKAKWYLEREISLRKKEEGL